VLVPNRFERGDSLMATKAYVDGDLAARVCAPFQNRDIQPRIEGEFLGQSHEFTRPLNPHSGSYCLRRDQLRTWSRHESFADRSRAFIGPLESAATLGIMKFFRVYKPAFQNAGFLEIEHQSNQFVSQLRRKCSDQNS
jgi:hypothetical protein